MQLGICYSERSEESMVAIQKFWGIKWSPVLIRFFKSPFLKGGFRGIIRRLLIPPAPL